MHFACIISIWYCIICTLWFSKSWKKNGLIEKFIVACYIMWYIFGISIFSKEVPNVALK